MEFHNETSTNPSKETTGFRWVLTSEERSNIAKILEIEEDTISHVKGNVICRERMQCGGCGKLSGLDDLVHNAVTARVHSRDFILEVMAGGPQTRLYAHKMQCSNYSHGYEGVFINWGGYME
ncbi:hypothetical protein TWF970_005055 [Orbilia oligospora]|uniref:Uncharacterized protein n=1 Tax=Orbilia oligospora TaxID=2813651 RepID=A0A7C8RF54_ORBOL|nr:hypothetical protein TWF970_005055 [Orbilia oligospora]